MNKGRAVQLPIDIESIKGFMDAEEGRALHEAALEASRLGPVLEIGSYCGKSTVYIGTACQQNGAVLYALDHHYGSEENQKGWEHHDEALYDAETDRLNTFPLFRRTYSSSSRNASQIQSMTGASALPVIAATSKRQGRRASGGWAARKACAAIARRCILRRSTEAAAPPKPALRR